jgi:hypothetical protein
VADFNHDVGLQPCFQSLVKRKELPGYPFDAGLGLKEIGTHYGGPARLVEDEVQESGLHGETAAPMVMEWRRSCVSLIAGSRFTPRRSWRQMGR